MVVVSVVLVLVVLVVAVVVARSMNDEIFFEQCWMCQLYFLLVSVIVVDVVEVLVVAK